MNASMISSQDPLGLGDLPQPRPEPGSLEKDWATVAAALHTRKKRRRQVWAGGLAAAASIALLVALLELSRPGAVGEGADGPVVESLDSVGQPSTEELVVMSQDLEHRLRLLRSQVGAMPSEIVVYQVELQDLISQVDDALGLSPDSRTLWAQRLGLQLDLMKLYRNQLRRDYARVASL